MSAAFDSRALEHSYAFLDDCPEQLLPKIVTLPIGTLKDRVAGINEWQRALLDGQLPPVGTWPGAPFDTPIRSALEQLNLTPFCRDQPELVENLLTEFLESFTRTNAEYVSEVAQRLKELEELERARRTQAQKTVSPRIRLDAQTLQKLREQAELAARQKKPDADSQFLANWSPRVRAWAEISEVFGDLGQFLGRGWDLSTNVLKHTGWLDLLRLRKLLETLPQLREIIRALGRLHAVNDGHSVAETILVPVQRLEEERHEVITPLIPAETRGIERSGEIARMLPVEASLLGHPKLRLLWHARRAERALLTYRVEGIDVERRQLEREEQVEKEGTRPRPERGPIIAIVDTSGSMHGAPEQVAKALVLEALRTAHAEKRRCFVFAYSGPGQVLEHELDLSRGGVERLLSFLGLSFHGGNDELSVVRKVTSRLAENAWEKADVLFVSDGEWPAPADLVETVKRARETGTRFHGVQVGSDGESGLHAICDPVHVFSDWTTFGSS